MVVQCISVVIQCCKKSVVIQSMLTPKRVKLIMNLGSNY